jgi:hypothetical protein
MDCAPWWLLHIRLAKRAKNCWCGLIRRGGVFAVSSDQCLGKSFKILVDVSNVLRGAVRQIMVIIFNGEPDVRQFRWPESVARRDGVAQGRRLADAF